MCPRWTATPSAATAPGFCARTSRSPGPTLAGPLRQGEAIRIGTGARVPAGSTTVIRDEYVTATAVFGKPGVANRPDAPIRDDTRRRGENCACGAGLASSGHRVSLALVSAAVSAETPTAELRGPLRARVILTGNEIGTEGRLAPGQTRDSLGPVLPHYLRALDITCAEVSHVPDRSDQTCELITATDTVDLVVVVGATRHGAADQLRRALQAARADTIVDGVSCRPAGSQLTAQVPGGPIVLCLPGKPLRRGRRASHHSADDCRRADRSHPAQTDQRTHR
jgi:molybdopterin molybdotransferase